MWTLTGHVNTYQYTRSDEHRYVSTLVWTHTFPQMLLQLAQLSLCCELVDGQGWGQREAESSPVPSLLCASVYPIPSCSQLCHPAIPPPPWGWGPLTVQSGWQSRDFIPPLPVGEGCGVLQGVACWERGRALTSLQDMFLGLQTRPWGLEATTDTV